MAGRERDAEAQRAAEAERARIARELHDVIAHSVSVMVVQAGAAERVLAHDPATAGEAMRAVQTTGRQAVSEMARLVGILREAGDEVELAPQPGLGDLVELVEQNRTAGLDLSLCVEGDERPLPPGVELTVYRVVQEALTNIRKHASGAHATVRLRYGSAAIRVEVTNPATAPTAQPGGGHGLVGMRERVAVYGGQLAAEPVPGGGYRVGAEIPVEAQP